MKNSKKLIALVLAMVMIFALTASALAATDSTNNTIEVTVSVIKRYYLDFTSKDAANGVMTVTLPEGSTATVDGKSYTSGTEVALSPKKDFCRLTIAAADGYTEKSYYFVTRYANDETIPYPASGTVVNPRPAMILKTAPNMDNAKAFVDFLFSDEAQKLVADAYLLPGRSDVQCENRTNLSDIPQITTDWDKMMEVASDTAAKLNSLCK